MNFDTAVLTPHSLFLSVALLDQDKDAYYTEYYRHWLHTDQRVDVPSEGLTSARIIGLDSAGYLEVEGPEGNISLAPDGNSFDMMHNLITIKAR